MTGYSDATSCRVFVRLHQNNGVRDDGAGNLQQISAKDADRDNGCNARKTLVVTQLICKHCVNWRRAFDKPINSFRDKFSCVSTTQSMFNTMTGWNTLSDYFK